MNSGLVTSTVIAGLLLMGILALNTRMSQESDYTVMRQITASNMNAIADMIEFDFRKVGYRAANPVILTADSTTFEFKADVDNDNNVEQVHWDFTNNDVTSTTNPRDKVLTRTVKSTTTSITLGVTNFNLTYFTKDHQTTTNTSKIRSIQVNLSVGSSAPIDGKYVNTSWEKLFVPYNLNN